MTYCYASDKILEMAQGTRTTVRLDDALLDRLRDRCRRSGLVQDRVIEAAIYYMVDLCTPGQQAELMTACHDALRGERAADAQSAVEADVESELADIDRRVVRARRRKPPADQAG